MGLRNLLEKMCVFVLNGNVKLGPLSLINLLLLLIYCGGQ